MNFRNLMMALLPMTAVVASAHPGHGLMDHGAGHVATSAYHLMVLAVFAIVMLGLGQVVRSAAAKKYLRLTGAAALVIAGALWGLGI